MVLAITSCSTIDCPLNNTVTTSYKLKGDVAKLQDTLTITTPRTTIGDTVLLNKAIGIDSFLLPMSYAQPEDILYFKMTTQQNKSFIDTLRITKEDQTHFESVDCPPAVFHQIKRVDYTKHTIDSVVIHHENVNYDATKAHFYIYFKSYLH